MTEIMAEIRGEQAPDGYWELSYDEPSEGLNRRRPHTRLLKCGNRNTASRLRIRMARIAAYIAVCVAGGSIGKAIFEPRLRVMNDARSNARSKYDERDGTGRRSLGNRFRSGACRCRQQCDYVGHRTGDCGRHSRPPSQRCSPAQRESAAKQHDRHRRPCRSRSQRRHCDRGHRRTVRPRRARRIQGSDSRNRTCRLADERHRTHHRQAHG